MKKICAIVLTVLQIFSISVCANAAQLTDIQKDDLYKLEIMTGDENGSLRLGDKITRAESAKMICVAGNFKLPLNDESESLFNDVSAKHWAYRYIYASKKHGIADGDDNGNFNPESNITNEEIVKMVVCLLGYREMAEQMGGFPAGYTATASRIGITKDMNLKPKTPATRNDVAVMISNALDMPVMVKKNDDYNENGDVVYIILDGKNGIPFSSVRGTRGLTFDTSMNNIDRLAQSFASQYPYKDGDEGRAIELYPNITYLTGIEKREDGIEYECPAIYDDRHVSDLVSDIRVFPTKLEIGDSIYDINCAIFNSKLLIPYDTFELFGSEVLFDKDSYVATIANSATTLEIIPNITGMRKNKADGYWVPLEICARFIGDTLYVPLDAVSNEFNYKVENDTEYSIKAYYK